MTRGSFLGDKVIGDWSKSWALKVELRHLGRGRILYSLSYDNGELNCSERVNREIFEGREAAGERCPDVVVLEIGYLNTGGGLWPCKAVSALPCCRSSVAISLAKSRELNHCED